MAQRYQPDQIITSREAASYLKIAIGTIRRLCQENRLPHFKIGNRLRFRVSDLYNLTEPRKG